MPYEGIFITFEGIEGTGKSTQTDLLCEHLFKEGIDHVRTVEPGGTPIGDEIRQILLSVDNKAMSARTELLLYAASRAQHVDEVIVPALRSGKVVVCDRFTDSTVAYQGYGRGLDMELIHKLNDICTGGIKPDITFLLDTEVEAGLSRNRTANKVDRLELEAEEFHQKVRKGYIEISEKESDRVRVIDSGQEIEKVSEEIIKVLTEFMKGATGASE